MANEKLTLVLDWYINPTMRRLWWPNRLAPLKRRAGRQDCPAVRPGPAAASGGRPPGGSGYHLPAAGALFADEGLPLVRVGTLINSPLNTVIALDKSIKTPPICKAKKSAIRSAVSSRLRWRPWRNMPYRSQSIKLINVNFQLTSALLAGQVDAVIGGYRNIEALELKLQGKDPQVMNVEDYGVPAYDELVIVANRDEIHAAKIKNSSPRCRRRRLSARASAGNLAGVCRRASGAEYRTEPAGLAANPSSVCQRSGGAG
jgi:putative hydroxymethylpyrimidine transport system substrate-binding protein